MNDLTLLSDTYSRRGTEQELFIEEVSATSIAERFGTPTYIYSKRALLKTFSQYKALVEGLPATICVAIKANSNLALLQLLKNDGSGFDVVSGGELKRVLRIGADPKKVVFAGVGKTDEEISLAIDTGIKAINVESDAELRTINEIAVAKGKKAQINLRVNPDVDALVHKHTATGSEDTKFGISFARIPELIRSLPTLPGIELIGLSCHIGSGLLKIEPFKEAYEKVASLYLSVKEQVPTLRVLDLGGGVGARYGTETPIDFAALREVLVATLERTGAELVIEPGKSIFANSCVLLGRTIFTKRSEEKDFLIIDAAMNDLIRPALYESYHEIQPAKLPGGRKPLTVDIVGPVCETGDFLGLSRTIPETLRGELVAIFSAGAYGMTMASNYNTRGRGAEVLVDGGKVTLIRKREDFEELIRSEILP